MDKLRGTLILLLLVVGVIGAMSLGAETRFPPGHCPLCGAEGIPVPERDQLNHCECEKWWRGKAPARLMFADCSLYTCVDNGPNEDTPIVYVDIHLYRCPKDGLLFTEPE